MLISLLGLKSLFYVPAARGKSLDAIPDAFFLSEGEFYRLPTDKQSNQFLASLKQTAADWEV